MLKFLAESSPSKTAIPKCEGTFPRQIMFAQFSTFLHSSSSFLFILVTMHHGCTCHVQCPIMMHRHFAMILLCAEDQDRKQSGGC